MPLRRKDSKDAPDGAPFSSSFKRPLSSERGGGVFLAILLILLIAASVLYYHKRIKAQSAPLATSVEQTRELTGREIGQAALKADEGPLISSDAVSASGAALSTAAAAYREGDYSKAAGILRSALKQDPTEEVRVALGKSLNKLALAKYDSGDYASAKDLLSEAVETTDDAVYMENLGNVHLKLKDYKAAAALFEQTRSPGSRRTLFGIYTHLGGQSYMAGDLKAAIDYYEKGLEIEPSDSSVKAALARLKQEYSVEGRMDVSDNRHFLVKFDGGENAISGHLIGLLLEEAYEKVGSDLNFYPDDRIEALLYSRENFRDVTRSPSWAGAIYDGRIKVPAGGVTEKTELLEKVIFHEYTHAVVHRLSGGRAPTWLNEGIAQYEEGQTSSDYSSVLRGFAATGKVRLRGFEGSFMGLNAQGAQAAYLLSLSSTEYIIREFGVFTVRRILENLGSGMSLDEAVSSATYLSYEDLEKSWLNSLR